MTPFRWLGVAWCSAVAVFLFAWFVWAMWRLAGWIASWKNIRDEVTGIDAELPYLNADGSWNGDAA